METVSPEKRDDAVQDAKEPPQWSDSEAQWLKYEKFIAEVSKLRSRPETPKPKWQKFLETTGGAALITVLIGGILGQVISLSIQSSLKDREHQQSEDKERSERALAVNNKFLEQGSETVRHGYELIGNCIAAADDLITISSDKFNKKGLTPERLKEQNNQKNGIITKYNETNTKWRQEQAQLGLLMRYYHHNAPGVADAWKDVQESTTNYMACALQDLNEYYDKGTSEDALTPCQDKKKTLMSTLDALARSVENYWKVIDKSSSR